MNGIGLHANCFPNHPISGKIFLVYPLKIDFLPIIDPRSILVNLLY